MNKIPTTTLQSAPGLIHHEITPNQGQLGLTDIINVHLFIKMPVHF